MNFQVRAAAVYALGSFINNSTERSDHANNIDHGVGMTLLNCSNDGNPLVRKVRPHVKEKSRTQLYITFLSPFLFVCG